MFGPRDRLQILNSPGRCDLQDIAFATDAAPLGVDKVNGTLDLDNERMSISNLTGEVGGGQISMPAVA